MTHPNIGLTRAIASDWREALAPVESDIERMEAFLEEESRAGRGFLPSSESIFRAFEQPLANIRVLIVGQDPYPTPGHPMGLSFAVQPDVRPLPRSLANIYKELHSDLGIEPATHGDLSAWHNQGVMLLNRCLTVQPGHAGSHRNQGWEAITDCAINALATRGGPLVAILWGRDAQLSKKLLTDIVTIESAHPSPLSVRRGFFGSRPFSRANTLLAQQASAPIAWGIPPRPTIATQGVLHIPGFE